MKLAQHFFCKFYFAGGMVEVGKNITTVRFWRAKFEVLTVTEENLGENIQDSFIFKTDLVF